MQVHDTTLCVTYCIESHCFCSNSCEQSCLSVVDAWVCGASDTVIADPACGNLQCPVCVSNGYHGGVPHAFCEACFPPLACRRKAASLSPLRINGLAGPLCTMQPQENWTLQDLRCALATATGIPMEEQRLISGSTLLGGAWTVTLADILPTDARDLVCLRSAPWIAIPVRIWSSTESVSWLRCTVEKAKECL